MLGKQSKSTFSGDYRRLLLTELKDRQDKNPSFSLRAFAKFLEISPALLSLLIAGKKRLSHRQAEKISEKLSLSPLEKQSLYQFMNSEFLGESVQFDSVELAQDQFSLISEWYHFAILTLGQLPNSRANPAWIARRLKISETQALDGLQRLERMKLIQVKNGNYRQKGDCLRVASSTPSSAIRKYHKQTLELAKEKVDDVDISLREFNSITMPANPAQIKKARRLIEEFKSQLNVIMEEGEKSEVYTLSIQLFPVTQSAQSLSGVVK